MSLDFFHGIETLEITDGTRPVKTVKSSIIGLIGTAPGLTDEAAKKFPVNTPVLITGNPKDIEGLGTDGTLKKAIDGIFDQTGAMVVVVRVEEVKEPNKVKVDEQATMANIIGDSSNSSGVHAFLASESVVHVTPKILCAPGFTDERPEVTNKDTGKKEKVANPVVAELIGVAEKLQAIVVADGSAESNTDAVTYKNDWGSDRLYIVSPKVKVFDSSSSKIVNEPASARVAGVIAKMDSEKGFWWSPSNESINGIVGVSRAIDFNMSDKNCSANFLNSNSIATIVHKNGYRLWGNRTCSTDPMWTFLSVRRTADMIYESIEQAFLWAMDRPMSANLILDIQESVNAYLRHLKAVGAILDGECWIDENLNTKEELMAGKLYLDFDIEPPAPLERLTFRAHRNNGYYEELINQTLKAS